MIIVGARVAGAATAILLGELGWRVLLCDRAALPSPAVSTHFFGPSVVRFLDELGVLEQVLLTGAPPLRRWHLEVHGTNYGAPMITRSPHTYNLCVRREVLDDILLRRALRESTVELRDRSRIHRLLWQDGAVVGIGGRGWQEKAQMVVGADGRGSFVARCVGAADLFDGGTLRATFHAYWEGVAPLPEHALELWHDADDVLQVGHCDRFAGTVRA